MNGVGRTYPLQTDTPRRVNTILNAANTPMNAGINNNNNNPAGNIKDAGGEWNANQTNNPNNPNVNANTKDPNNNNGSRVNIAPSGASIKSILKSGGFQSLEDNKKRFFRLVENICNSRTVEILGGLGSRAVKEDAINTLGELWKQLQSSMTGMADCIGVMNFEAESSNLVDVVQATIKEVEAVYLDLVQNSSIRFLDTVCTVHDLQYKHLIDLLFDPRAWSRNTVDLLKKAHRSNSKRSNSKNNGNNDTDNSSESESTSCLASLCCCCNKTKTTSVTPLNPVNDPISRQMSQNVRR